jgi:hypothetical protein
MNQQRGIYQPMAEKVPLYDLADEEIDEERSRVPLLIVALVVWPFAGVPRLPITRALRVGAPAVHRHSGCQRAVRIALRMPG